jgi:hypothetical protein
MRTLILIALLASSVWVTTGCDNSTPAPPSSDPAAREAALPGVPKEGSDAPRAKK